MLERWDDYEKCLQRVKTNGFDIRRCRIDEKQKYQILALEALKENGYCLEYIINPTDEMYIIAVKFDSELIKLAKNKSIKFYINAVKTNRHVEQR